VGRSSVLATVTHARWVERRATERYPWSCRQGIWHEAFNPSSENPGVKNPNEGVRMREEWTYVAKEAKFLI
jgi:hypothetical protein